MWWHLGGDGESRGSRKSQYTESECGGSTVFENLVGLYRLTSELGGQWERGCLYWGIPFNKGLEWKMGSQT